MIGITLGDPGGIGIEVTLKALSNFKEGRFILFGNERALEYYSKKLSLKIPKNAEIWNIKGDFFIGEINPNNGEVAYNSIMEAIKAVKNGMCNAIVTAPINKKALQLAGFDYPGHTEILARNFSCEDFAMMMVSEEMKIVFVTTHIPLSSVSLTLSKEKIIKKTKLAYKYLKLYWGLENPSFGVLALNPHKGDEGLFGREEEEVIKPAIEELRMEGVNIEGPFPSDTYWISQRKDCTVALYHDQGMIPFKLKSYGKGVNITLGLPIPRTSPDHGTAFDIAGKGVANPGSMKEAIKLALKIADV
ncbi:MAG: 4-hydroxythreonine-4-phosphate dehydrogenase PdxA [candidate division WOR-3 bacterium]